METPNKRQAQRFTGNVNTRARAKIGRRAIGLERVHTDRFVPMMNLPATATKGSVR